MNIGNFVYLLTDIKLSSGMFIPKKSVGIISKIIEKIAFVIFMKPSEPIAIDINLLRQFNPLETGDDYSMKVCNRCHRLLSVNNFEKNQNAKNNKTRRRPSCKDCRAPIDGKTVSTNDRKKWEKTKPNLQWWTCPICHKRTIPGLTSKVVLDHNHTTGIPRAWICDSCNTGIGRFQDNKKILQNAIQYITNQTNN